MLKDIQTTGVMFTDFPTLHDVSYTNYVSLYSADVPDEIMQWHTIAFNPNTLMYGDDDHEAMDVTNWDVLISGLGDIPTIESTWSVAGYMMHGVEDALAARCAYIDKVLIVAPDHEYLDELRDLQLQLADYPLLGEDAYCQLEYDAWFEYAPQAFADELSDANRDERYSEELFAAIEYHNADLLSILDQQLDYQYGFTGEYGPAFLTILDQLIAEYDPQVCAILSDVITLPASVQSRLDPNQPEMF